MMAEVIPVDRVIRLVGVIVVIGVACCVARPGNDQGAGSQQLIAAAERFVDQLAAEDYTAAVATFDSVMARAMPAATLKQTWDALLGQVGAFKERLATKAAQDRGFDIVTVTCAFQAAAIDVHVVFNAQGRITGLRFAPGQAPDTYEAPSYVDPDAFREEEVTVGSEGWPLPGTLTLPADGGPFPALVLVHGSGPQDRDETIGPSKPFRDLAGGLASRGIAILRYEKRSKEHGARLAADQEGMTVNDETVDDALAAVEFLRTRAEVDGERIFVLGHSLGGMLAPRIGQRDPAIAGLIIMAGNTRPLEDLIVDQIEYIISLGGEDTEAAKDKLEAMKAQAQRVKDPDLSVDTPAVELPFGAPASYWLDLKAYHPAETAAALTQRILTLQGGRDYQVTREDFEGWKTALAGRDNVQLKWYDNLNHLFAEGEGMATPEEYAKPAHIAQQVIEDIAAWVKE
jgi:dienelactone hydrolase